MKTLRTASTIMLLVLISAISGFGQRAEERYIVVLRSREANPRAIAAQIGKEHGVNIGAVYRHALRGFAFAGPPQAAQAIARRMDVAYVEPDQLFHAVDWPTGIDRADVDLKIDIDGNGGDLLNNNVRVAVLDTGVDRDHPDLNISGGIHFYNYLIFLVMSDENYDDGNGHGTHVSGTIGAKDNGIDLYNNDLPYEVVGVAPGVSIYAVKVLDDNGSGYTSAIIAGVDHVAENADTIQVANMSLRGGFSQALNDAVAGAVNAGIVFVVAAGNDSDDASYYSPASEPNAITVSALADSDGLPHGTGADTGYGPDDSLASFSNYGALIDICAPGVDILSAFPDGYAWGSGTSMASPHVAGAAALYIANALNPYDGWDRLVNGNEAVQAVRDALVNAGWQEGEYEYFSGDIDGFPEPLLNVGRLNLDGIVENNPPIADAGGPYTGVAGALISFDGSRSSDPDGDPLTYDWDFGDGTIGSGITPTHTYLAAGTYTVTLTVTDVCGATDTASLQVSVSPSDGNIIRVEDISVKVIPGKKDFAEASVAIGYFPSGNPVEGALVTGVWSGIVSGTSTASTGSEGVAILQSPRTPRSGTYTFTVTNVTADGLDYAPEENIENSDSSDSETPPPPATGDEMHVGNLFGLSFPNPLENTWGAGVSIRIHDQNHVLIAGATVHGTWSGGYKGTASCTTISYGPDNIYCQLATPAISMKRKSVTFTVTDVTHKNYTYQPASNHSDGDSDGTKIVINKP